MGFPVPYEERLRQLGFFNVEEMNFRRVYGLILRAVINRCLIRENKDTGRLFSVVFSDRPGDHGHKLINRKFCLNIRKHSFTAGVLRHWNRLLSVRKSLSLGMLKIRLDEILSNCCS